MREVTKAQAGKRAQIEKLIEDERKKQKLINAPPRPTVRRYIPPTPRPIVRLPGQPLTSIPGQPLTSRPGQPLTSYPPPKPGPLPYRRNKHLYYIPRPTDIPLISLPHHPRKISVNLPLPIQAGESIGDKKFTFLLLPGELRNKIYDYAFPKEYFQLQWIPKTTEHLTYCLPKRGKLGPKLGPSAGRRRRLFDYPRRVRSQEVIPPYRLSPGPAALLLVNKKINEEATPIFYASSTFSFHASSTFRAFLKSLRPGTKAAIQSLALKHATAGCPSWTEFEHWKVAADRNWDDLLWDASDDLVGLKHLSIDLTINDIPILFGPNAAWKLPFLAFQEMGIKKCDVKLRNVHTVDTVLEVEQMILKQEILGKEYVPEEEELDEEKKALAGMRRRVRVVNLVNY